AVTYYYTCIILFFFQAEDGIRDGHVTGVQTCALPIWITGRGLRRRIFDFPTIAARSRTRSSVAWVWANAGGSTTERCARASWPRSEERRVGKECRSRWWAGH